MTRIVAIFTLLTFLAVSCKEDGVMYDPEPFELQYNSLPAPNLPADNPLTVQGVELGRMLFYDPQLSRDGSQACASCHRQTDAFTDTATFSLGVAGLEGKRQAMTIFNMAWHENDFFWDGRADLLRDQAILPIQDPLEMDETLDRVIEKLNEDSRYQDQFKRAFDTEEASVELLALALEQFMLSIVSTNSKYDQYLAGSLSLSESEARGMELFFAEFNPFFPEVSGADCAHCHAGNNFENDLYMNNGLDSDADFLDFGRELVTMDPTDRAKFKVTSLRNIAESGPYMHDGRFKTLEEVVEHYNSGIQFSSTVDPTVENTRATGLMLTDQDKEDLVNFLKTLSDPDFYVNPAYQSPF